MIQSVPMPPKAYAARTFTPAVMEALGTRFHLTRNAPDLPLAARALAEAAQGCNYLFVSVTERVTAEVIDSLLPDLRLIATLSVGIDHIDLVHAERRGVAVLTTPDVLSVACAELAWMLILTATRRGHEADALVRSGEWKGWAPTQLLGRDVRGRRLGIFGMGRIGREIAAIGAGFGVEVHYHGRNRQPPEQEKGAIYHGSAETLLAHSDILVLAAPGSAELDGFLDAQRIDLLPADPIVVNVSRGDLVDDDALIAALESRRVFAAGLDVFRGEPALDRRYATLRNVFLSAHIGSATIEARDAMGFILLDGITAFEAGERAPNQVR